MQSVRLNAVNFKVIWTALFILHFPCLSALIAQDRTLIPEYEKKLREAQTDSAKAMALQYLAFHLSLSDRQKSIEFGEEALQIARHSGNAALLSQCQNGVGWALFSSGNSARARVLLDSSIQYMRASHNYFDLAPVCNNQGWVCLKQGDNIGALQYFREGLNAAEVSKDKGRIAFMNRSLSSFYNTLKEYDKSILHIQVAFDKSAELRDTVLMADCLITMGNIYSGLKQDEKALDYYYKALPLSQHLGDLIGEALIYENVAMVLGSLKRFPEAFDKLEMARVIMERMDDKTELSFLYLTLGKTYMDKRDTALAIAPLEKARQLSMPLQLADVLSEVFPLLHVAYAAVGAPEKAYQTLLSYQTWRDTTEAQESRLDLQRLKAEFETEQKEKDIQIKTLENTRLQSRLWLALAGLGLALMAGFAFWYRAHQRRKTNAALESKNQEILVQKAAAEKLRERAEQSEAVKEKFLAAMSHEIRTPMNAIVGLSQLLDAGSHEPTTAHNISIIRQSSEHLMTILNDILDLAKIEAHKIELRPKKLELLPLLQLIRDTFSARAQEKGLQLLLDLDEQLPGQVMLDPVRFAQVLNNLVSNAIKFTESGKVVLSARRNPMASSGLSEASLTFSVKDTGIGISLEHQNAVFEEFTQAEPGIAANYGGTGLGLSIARSLVAQMGGTLQLLSNPGQGAEFFFTIHLPIPEKEKQAAPIQMSPQTRIPKLVCKAPVHLLLLEDNTFNQEVAKQTIAAICPEISLEITSKGEEALEWVKTRQFDLILTDLQMPGLDGYETTRRLRAAQFKQPIIALTASAVRTEEPKCLDAGMQEMLLKPIAPADMADLLLKYLSDKLAHANLEDEATLTQDSNRIPAALLHYAGGNENIASQLLIIIQAELSQHLPAIQQLRAVSDHAEIRKRVHKLRPQLLALGKLEYIPLMDALELDTSPEIDFWNNVRTLESVLETTLAKQ